MPQWLYQRLKVESPEITPDFSLRNSSRWQTALEVLCGEGTFEDEALRAFYLPVGRRSPNSTSDNSVFESVLMSIHYFASLERLVANNDEHYSHARTAIVTWYYGVYYAALAMLAAADGGIQQTHASNARGWGRHLVDNGLVLAPFTFHLSTLVKADCDDLLTAMRAGNPFSLNDEPVNVVAAQGGCISYLKGTADRERGIVEDLIRRESGFKALAVDNFRTRRAQEYRDNRLAGRTVNPMDA